LEIKSIIKGIFPHITAQRREDAEAQRGEGRIYHGVARREEELHGVEVYVTFFYE